MIYTGYIYCITNCINGKQYVGQTNTTVKRRYGEHIRCAKSGQNTTSLLYKAMQKYGVDNFLVETLETVSADTRESLKSILNDREIFHVADKNTYKPYGYNMTAGGFAFADHVMRAVYKVDSDGNVIARYESMADAEFKHQLPYGSINRAFEYSNHYANGWYWYDATEAEFGIGDNIGKQKSYTTPVYCFDLTGVLHKEFISVKAAEDTTGINHSHICAACNGNRKSAGGYLWSYFNKPPTYESRQKDHKNVAVVQLSMDGEFIKEYASATTAANELGLQQSLISACCNGRRKSTGGYRWAFIM